MSKTKKEHKNIVKHTNNGKKESVQSVAKETERVTWSNKQTNEEKNEKILQDLWGGGKGAEGHREEEQGDENQQWILG